MKKLIMIATAILLCGVLSSTGQTAEKKSKGQKNNQVDLSNDFFISYGTGTVFYFINNEGMTANSMSGTFMAGFARSLNPVIAVGFQMSYTTIDRSGTNYDYSYPPTSAITEKMTDNLWQGLASVRFRYLNKPSFCMYSGIGMGVTMDFYQKNYDDVITKGQKLLPAAQLTLLGFRFGRALSFFGEFGVGTNSILNAGVSYKFGDGQ
jgi:opacity protein-like surface antigen